MSNMPTQRDFLESIRGWTNDQDGTKGVSASPRAKGSKLGVLDTNFSGNGLPRVLFDGEDSMSNKGYAWTAPYIPTAGDRVMLQPVGNSYVIVGSVIRDMSKYDTGWVTSGLTASTGITLGTYRIRRIGNQVVVAIDPFTVDSLSVSTIGDIGNRAICTVPSAFQPSAVQALSSASTGRVASGYINGSGVIVLSALTPDATQTGTTTITNTQFSLGGSYFI